MQWRVRLCNGEPEACRDTLDMSITFYSLSQLLLCETRYLSHATIVNFLGEFCYLGSESN